MNRSRRIVIWMDGYYTTRPSPRGLLDAPEPVVIEDAQPLVAMTGKYRRIAVPRPSAVSTSIPPSCEAIVP